MQTHAIDCFVSSPSTSTTSHTELGLKKRFSSSILTPLDFTTHLSWVIEPLLLLTKWCEGAYGAGVPAALPAGLSAAALTHTGPRDTTAPS